MAKTIATDPVARGFIKYLQKTGQLGKLPLLAKEHIRLSRSLLDPHLAVVQTVVPMTAADKKALQTKLEAIFGRSISIENRVNKDILGGMLIRVGDQVLDTTLKTRLESLNEQLSYA